MLTVARVKPQPAPSPPVSAAPPARCQQAAVLAQTAPPVKPQPAPSLIAPPASQASMQRLARFAKTVRPTVNQTTNKANVRPAQPALPPALRVTRPVTARRRTEESAHLQTGRRALPITVSMASVALRQPVMTAHVLVLTACVYAQLGGWATPAIRRYQERPALLRPNAILVTASMASAALRRTAAPMVHVPAREACAHATTDGRETHAVRGLQAKPALLRLTAQLVTVSTPSAALRRTAAPAAPVPAQEAHVPAAAGQSRTAALVPTVPLARPPSAPSLPVSTAPLARPPPAVAELAPVVLPVKPRPTPSLLASTAALANSRLAVVVRVPTLPAQDLQVKSAHVGPTAFPVTVWMASAALRRTVAPTAPVLARGARVPAAAGQSHRPTCALPHGKHNLVGASMTSKAAMHLHSQSGSSRPMSLPLLDSCRAQ